MRVRDRQADPGRRRDGWGLRGCRRDAQVCARAGAGPRARWADRGRGSGSDVPSQLDPGPSLGTGAGEIVRPVDVNEPRPARPPAAVRAVHRRGLPRGRPARPAAAGGGADRAASRPGGACSAAACAPGSRFPAGWSSTTCSRRRCGCARRSPRARCGSPGGGRPGDRVRLGSDRDRHLLGPDGFERARLAAQRLRAGFRVRSHASRFSEGCRPDAEPVIVSRNLHHSWALGLRHRRLSAQSGFAQ